MIPAMPATATSARRASVTALRFGRVSMAGAFAALILFAGVWGSWGTAQHVMLVKGRETGTVEVTRCAGDTCTGPFTPTSAGARPRARVEIAHSVAVRTGATYDVVLKPGSGDAVRSGPAGILYAWLPLGGGAAAGRGGGRGRDAAGPAGVGAGVVRGGPADGGVRGLAVT